jgi:hypothetical protein
MRVETKKFDDETITALRTLGFDVADDNESAEIEAKVIIYSTGRAGPQGPLMLHIQFEDESHWVFDIARTKIT